MVFVTLVLIILAVQEIAVTVIVNYKIKRYDTKMRWCKDIRLRREA